MNKGIFGIIILFVVILCITIYKIFKKIKRYFRFSIAPQENTKQSETKYFKANAYQENTRQSETKYFKANVHQENTKQSETKYFKANAHQVNTSHAQNNSGFSIMDLRCIYFLVISIGFVFGLCQGHILYQKPEYIRCNEQYEILVNFLYNLTNYLFFVISTGILNSLIVGTFPFSIFFIK